MKMTNVQILEEINKLMINGNWSNAQELFKGINIHASEFTDWLEFQDIEIIKDFALLGFYCRDYSPLNDREY